MLRRAQPYFYLLPAGIILLVFHLLPFLAVIWISLFKDWGTDAVSFVGLTNYREIIGGGEFIRCLKITLWYAVGTIPVLIFLAMIFAVILRRKIVGGTIYRVIYFLPYITSTVASAAVWKWIFHADEKGLANSCLTSFGFETMKFTQESRGIFELITGGPLPILGEGPSLALTSIMVFAVWQMFGFFVIIFAAGLAQISDDVYEAASLDGAGVIRTFLSITLPLMKPIVVFAVIISTIGAFQTFNQIYIMAPGERLFSAQNVTMFIFNQFWNAGRLGWAAAASVLLFILLIGLTAFQLLHYRKGEES